MVIARNSNLLGKITILIIVGLCVNTALALDGSGIQEDPWLIQSLDDFNDFAADANYWAGFTRLETDVNLAGMVYDRAVIAWDVNNTEDWFQGIVFTGVFDGNDHKILNLTIDDGGAGNDHVGLFGRIDKGEVRNLGLEGGSVIGGSIVGGLVGYNYFGNVLNCYAAGNVSGNGQVGGLVGFSPFGSVLNCYAAGNVSGNAVVGGLMGKNWASVSNCYSTCDVSGDLGVVGVGGLMGYNEGSISNCYSTGDVSDGLYVGGLVGWHEGGIFNCYSTGDVNGVDVGGLVGLSFGSVLNCYAAGNVSGNGLVGGLVGRNWAIVSNCYSTGDVSGDLGVGGLMGLNLDPITNCYSSGYISGYGEVGGLVGSNSSLITNSYSTSSVSGDWGTGGLVGENVGIISNCYSKGYVSGDVSVGGLVGSNGITLPSGCHDGVITSSYWDTKTSGEPNMCGQQVCGSTGCDNSYGKTTVEMHQQSTFTDWDFINVWNIGENQTYPYLRVYLPSDINKDGIVNFLDVAITANQWMEGQ